MALPPRVHGPRLIASMLMAGAGIASLVVTLQDQGAVLAEAVLGQPVPNWFRSEPGQRWQIVQSVLVISGGLGGVMGVFTLTAIGILAGLVVTTPVGLVTALPSFLLLITALLRLRAFYEFMPRWRGPGPRPPGPEYR